MHASNHNNHKSSTMENTNTKKRKLKHTFLTTSKKCKWYCQQKSNICNATPNISDSSSDTDTSSHGGILFSPSPQKGILKKPSFTKTKIHYKSKYVQAKPSIKHQIRKPYGFMQSSFLGHHDGSCHGLWWFVVIHVMLCAGFCHGSWWFMSWFVVICSDLWFVMIHVIICSGPCHGL